ncbi:MAG: MarR family EPS-associated transcriptional regulator [Gammaproteobacteria bacterium]
MDPKLPKITEDDLDVLHLVDKHPGISQRMMALRSGFSLGKVNYCLKSLAKVGYIKMHNFRSSKNKSKYAYVLTPKGIREKIIITKQFLNYKQAEYEKLYNYINKS